jgi:alkylhydroperoxidase family enzyme
MDRFILGRGAIRAGLLALALPQLAIGVWALVSPRGWFENFPGAGRSWLPLYEGDFDQHLVTDVGSTFLALGVILVLAAVWMDRRVVLAATIGYLVYQVPHSLYHFASDEVLTTGDQIANGVGLALVLFLALGIIVGTVRPRGATPAGRPSEAGTGRLSPPPGGLVARASRSYSRRRYGKEMAPVEAYLHHRRLLYGYGAFETATLGAHRVDEKLKMLAEMKAAAVVGCEWCLDFGSKLCHDEGVPERQLRELPLYWTSDAFDDLERLVLDYAAAMSRTPSEVDEGMVARLREHFDDAQMVELTNVIALENFRARFNHALGLEPQGFAEGAACVVPELAAAAGNGRKVTPGDRQPRSPDAV